MIRILSTLFIVLGLLFLLGSFMLFWEQTTPKVVASQLKGEEHSLQKAPIVISFPSLNISLPILPAVKKEDRWITTSKGVSFDTSSVLPGERGNSIMYGHNWLNLLGNIKNISSGDTIIITFNNHEKKYFHVIKKVTVKSSDTSLLNNTKKNILTIYTCTGLFDTQRLFVIAELDK